MIMMLLPAAANDVSPLTLRNDVAPVGRNDVMFAHHVPQARIISEATSFPQATSFARQGKHHSKTLDLIDKSSVFDGPPGGIRTPDLQNRNLLRYPTAPRTEIIYSIVFCKRRQNSVDSLVIHRPKFCRAASLFACRALYFVPLPGSLLRPPGAGPGRPLLQNRNPAFPTAPRTEMR